MRRTGYYCPGPGQLVEGRGARHLRIGGAVIDSVVAEAFLTALAQWRRQLEQARYQAGKVECRYRAVDPETGWSPAVWKPTGRER